MRIERFYVCLGGAWWSPSHPEGCSDQEWMPVYQQANKSCGVSQLIVFLLIKSGKRGLQIQHSLIFIVYVK